ncbi:hypothetical protein Avbf_17793 [Armadillidium vulgare]|nr:hypothetical protein Avbf_17793 [Armadillidium vulgare]
MFDIQEFEDSLRVPDEIEYLHAPCPVDNGNQRSDLYDDYLEIVELAKELGIESREDDQDSIEDLMKFLDGYEIEENNETCDADQARTYIDSFSPPRKRSRGSVEDIENVQKSILRIQKEVETEIIKIGLPILEGEYCTRNIVFGQVKEIEIGLVQRIITRLRNLVPARRFRSWSGLGFETCFQFWLSLDCQS